MLCSTNATASVLSSGYKVTFQCKKTLLDQPYDKIKQQWCDENSLKKITEKFIKSNSIISFKHFTTDSELTWIYVFNSKNDFLDWNNEVFYSGAFNSLKIPDELNFRMKIEQNSSI